MREYVRDLPPVVAGQLKIYFGEDVRLVFAAKTDYAFALKVFHEGLPIVSLRYQEIARPLPGTADSKPGLRQQLESFKQALDRHTGTTSGSADVPAFPSDVGSLPACSILGG